MKQRIAFFVLALLILTGAFILKNASHVSEPVAPRSHEEPEYFAEHTSECGLDLLHLASVESGPFEKVVPIGPEQPNERLRRNVWHWGRYRIRGRFTGARREISECGSFAEFEVHAFRPWGKVQRCASPGALDDSMLTYTEALSVEHYVAEDFIDGPWPPSFDEGTCRLIAACPLDPRRAESRPRPEDVIDGEELPSLDGRYCPPDVSCGEHEKRIVSCAEDIWCCQLLPMNDAATP
ncbi:hypothetical protein [Archangium primigenium]|uniref:hypothetical protein n=1 Tax=[Archangium] primigenium TaxID=2792470 RepID=UPI001956E058|nr:hypothetical protein [Archangium primigenium]MBM7117502.1 hypothetical protein [Archangium primigenium]